MIISYSEIAKIQTCKRQWYYRFDLGLRPEHESDAVTTGTNGHKLLQNFYNLLEEGSSKEIALKVVTAQAVAALKEHQFSDGNLLKAWTLVDNYIRATDFVAKAVMVENRFLVPLTKLAEKYTVDIHGLHSVQVGFTPDLVLERSHKFLDVEDYKFIQRAWSQKKINRFAQLKVYQLLLEAMGYEISRTVLRTFNVTTGKITAYPYPMSHDEKEQVLSDFVEGIREVAEYRMKSLTQAVHHPRTMNNNACQFCDFELPCTLQAQGKSAERTLATQYIKSEYSYAN